MKKHTAVLIWSAVVLLLVVTCFGIYFSLDESLNGQTKNEAVEAFNCISTDIEKYSVLDGQEGYTIKKDDDGWFVEEDKNAQLDQSVIEKMVAAVSRITANGTINRKELDKYDTSKIKSVSLKIKDSNPVEIKFLGTLNNLCAFKVSGDKKIYVMYESSRDILAPQLDTLRITNIFPMLKETETLPDYYKFTDYDGNVLEVRLKTSAEFAKSKDNRYIMIKPYLREVNDELFEQQIAVKIPSLKAKSFVKNPSTDLSVYGLNKEARAELSFKWLDADETLFLGKEDGAMTYAKKKNNEDIYLIESSLLEFLQTEPFYVLESGILKAKAENIVSVRIVAGDMVYDVTSANKGTANKQFFINGKNASADVFEGIVEELAEIRFSSEITTVPKNTKDIEASVVYNNVAYSQKINLAKINDKTYAAFLDGKAEFQVDAASVEQLLNKLEKANINPLQTD